MGYTFDAEYTAQLEAMADRRGQPAQMPIAEARIAQDGPESKKDRKLIEPGFVPPGTWLVPVYTYAGDNSRGLKKRIGRSGHERWAVHEVMGRLGVLVWPEFSWDIHFGLGLKVLLTRLGPRKLDSDNLAAALKYLRDAVAERFGVDDGDSRWNWLYGQEISPAYGVRIEIE